MKTDSADEKGRLVQNILYFCRALRRAGVPVGTAQVQDCIRAVRTVGFTARTDFQTALRACLVTRPEHIAVFDQTFRLFWRDPEFLETLIQSLLPMMQTAETAKKPKDAEHRAAEAMAGALPQQQSQQVEEEITLDAQFSFSQTEKLGAMDFEQMSAAEIKDAERAIADLNLTVPKRPSRRFQQTKQHKQIDPKATIAKARQTGGEVLQLCYKKPRLRVPNLVVLCDVSGSMTTYSRMMMHFIHALSLAKGNQWASVHGFTFGTRLTNITRSLSTKDADAALRIVGTQVQDWDGGTQIGENLAKFNKDWARRVLNGKSVVLLVTDGLERAETNQLEIEVKRLQRSCDQLIWLNPLLRFSEFEPKAAGIRAMLPNVDQFAACHSLNALGDLSDVLSGRVSSPNLNAMLRR